MSLSVATLLKLLSDRNNNVNRKSSLIEHERMSRRGDFAEADY